MPMVMILCVFLLHVTVTVFIFVQVCYTFHIYYLCIYTYCWTPLDYSGTFRFLYQLATTSAWFYFEIHVRHYRIYMSEMKWVHLLHCKVKPKVNRDFQIIAK